MENNRIFKVAIFAKLEVKRKVGRPKLRRLDDIKADLKIIGIKVWRRKTQDRSEWMDITEEAEVTLRGSLYHGKSIRIRRISYVFQGTGHLS